MRKHYPVFCPQCGSKIVQHRHSEVDGLRMCSKKCEMEYEETKALASIANTKLIRQDISASLAWRPNDLDLVLHVIAPRVGVISDIHCPVHSEKWLTAAISTFKHYGINHVIINGDLIDATQISRHAGSYYRNKSELNSDLEAADSVLTVLEKNFEHLYLDASNHDMRVIHRFGGEVSFQRAMKLLGSHKIKITSRSYCKVNDHVIVCHPRQYSRIRGGLAQKLAIRWQSSVLTGHQHHSAMSISPDGKWQACDVGCLVDVDRQDYIRNELTDHVEPTNGFAIIFGNKIQCYDKFTNWNELGLSSVGDLCDEK